MTIQWIDAEQVGRILGYRTRVVLEKLAKRPGFPEPMRAAGVGHPRWRRDEIERWAEQQRPSAANPASARSLLQTG